MRVRVRKLLAIVLLGTAVAWAPEPAHAAGETLRRALGNALQGPLDMALTPAVAVHTVVANAQAGGYEPPAAAAPTGQTTAVHRAQYSAASATPTR